MPRVKNRTCLLQRTCKLPRTLNLSNPRTSCQMDICKTRIKATDTILRVRTQQARLAAKNAYVHLPASNRLSKDLTETATMKSLCQTVNPVCYHTKVAQVA